MMKQDLSRLSATPLVRVALSVAVAVLAVVSLSCSRSAEKADVERAVVDYNNALMQAYRDADVTYVESCATPDQLHRLMDVIVGLKQEKKRLRIRQDSFAVEYVNVEEKTAELVTRERWTYWTEDTASQERLDEEKTESYRIVYTLVKDADRWLVDTLSRS